MIKRELLKTWSIEKLQSRAGTLFKWVIGCIMASLFFFGFAFVTTFWLFIGTLSSLSAAYYYYCLYEETKEIIEEKQKEMKNKDIYEND